MGYMLIQGTCIQRRNKRESDDKEQEDWRMRPFAVNLF